MNSRSARSNKNSIDPEDIWLEWKTGGLIPLTEDGDPYNYIQVINGSILLRADDVNAESKDQLIGGFRLKLMEVDAAINAGVDVFDVFDSDNSETHQIYNALFDEDSWPFKESVLEIVGDDPAFTQNVLILDRLGILPEFRGQRLGLLVMHRLIQQFGGRTGMIALDPAPFVYSLETLQKQEWPTSEVNEDDPSVETLRAYYRLLGCADLPGTPIMALSPVYNLPPVSKIKKKGEPTDNQL